MSTLNVINRDKKKKSITKGLRRKGKIPAIVYGKDISNQTIAVDEGDMLRLLRNEGRNAIIKLELDNGQAYSVMAHDIQFDHLKDEIVHIDFVKIDMKSEVDTLVPVTLKGESVGEKEGGIVEQSLVELNVRALPSNIPNHIEADISELKIGDSIRVADISDKLDVEVLNDENDVIASIQPPTTLKEETDDDAPEEPEVINEKGSGGNGDEE
ncbi:large subunit ribosomal protein L25 [Scopulibacillus daqui]|uniref:Large ribosomal subunit protein bL25 n=1 Tax=Scopulibacillus daqui TaxID=1469162 RepID=A0ABS2Q2L8_9BACL|nr:50S ribosomal protein L25/general stress protein Ctc [Scopulibacillus daqui]MBM7646463.1 large subunit ribosomal protein L25 [Scopulibacillus daqui]